MKIYIAGKITGEPMAECRLKFKKAAEYLSILGAEVINPFDLGLPEHYTFEQCKSTCFNALASADAIFMLNDWKKSPGARVELHEAMRLKLDVYFETAGDYNMIGNLIAAETAAQ